MTKAGARFGSDADLRRRVEHGLDCGLRSRPCAFLRPLRGVVPSINPDYSCWPPDLSEVSGIGRVDGGLRGGFLECVGG